jgi:hypothetical protein
VAKSAPLGALGDVPVLGDDDGIGRAEIAVFRPVTVTWFLGAPRGPYSVQLGAPGDIPVPADDS